MEGFNQERRGLFDGQKVPFDLNAIAFAVVFVILYQAGILAIEAIQQETDIVARITADLASRVGLDGLTGTAETTFAIVQVAENDHVITEAATAKPLVPSTWLLFVIWNIVIWALFGGAITRIAAMKVAREEGLDFKDAAQFALGKLPANALTVVFTIGIFSLFYVVFNATIAGGLTRIPVLGDMLLGILFPFVLLSTFFMTFALALGIIGLNLSVSAIAAEASDTFEGVTRAWNFILSRPWQVLLHHALIVAYVVVVLFFGNLFLHLSVSSLSLGWWGMGNTPRTLEIVEWKQAPTAEGTNSVALKNVRSVTVPGKGDYLYGRVFGDFAQSQSDGRHVNVATDMESTLATWTAAWVIFWVWLARQILYGYLVSYVFCATTLSYFVLRRDVEGDDYSEINLEDDDDDGFDLALPVSPVADPASDTTPPGDEDSGGKDDVDGDPPSASAKDGKLKV